jgi:two-component system, NtrC family, response regulator GlrR
MKGWVWRMKPARILLLDLSSAADSGDALSVILKSGVRPDGIELRREAVREEDAALRHGELLAVISSSRPDVIILTPTEGRLKQTRMLFQSLRREGVTAPLIVTETGEADEMFEWLKLGDADFVDTPLRAGNVLPRVWRMLERLPHSEVQTRALEERLGARLLVGESRAFLKEVNKIPLLAKCNATVLISGETGTGKEVCARAIHYLGPWAGKPFIPVNCGAIPAELVENELFGHERGAFTGAKSSQVGLIQEADGGTLFLDEIDCLPPLSQVKLLRFLQEKEYRQLGSTKMLRADVRVIAATNSDPEEAVRAGSLRRDLYYRLNVIPLALPPLRERREDVPVLARHFLSKYSAEFAKRVTDFSPEAMRRLVTCDWPGNVRELEHVVVRAVVLCEQALVRDEDISLPARASAELEESFQGAKNRVVAEFEKGYIERALLASQGNISRAARASQKSRRAFWELIRKYRIDVNNLKPRAS